jgi:hypothetical protein
MHPRAFNGVGRIAFEFLDDPRNRQEFQMLPLVPVKEPHFRQSLDAQSCLSAFLPKVIDEL